MAKFEPGQGGRKAGSPNRTTAQMKEVLTRILSEEFDNLEQYKEDLTSKEWLDIMVKLTSYVLPKQTQMEATIQEFQQPDWDKLFKTDEGK